MIRLLIADDEKLEREALAELARSQVRAVRFIELMPIGRAKEFFPVSGTDVQQRLEEGQGGSSRGRWRRRQRAQARKMRRKLAKLCKCEAGAGRN